MSRKNLFSRLDSIYSKVDFDNVDEFFKKEIREIYTMIKTVDFNNQEQVKALDLKVYALSNSISKKDIL